MYSWCAARQQRAKRGRGCDDSGREHGRTRYATPSDAGVARSHYLVSLHARTHSAGISPSRSRIQRTNFGCTLHCWRVGYGAAQDGQAACPFIQGRSDIQTSLDRQVGQAAPTTTYLAHHLPAHHLRHLHYARRATVRTVIGVAPTLHVALGPRAGKPPTRCHGDFATTPAPPPPPLRRYSSWVNTYRTPAPHAPHARDLTRTPRRCTFTAF